MSHESSKVEVLIAEGWVGGYLRCKSGRLKVDMM